MQTVNFQCGHCHKLMGVGENLLGQQVRCPHCQQVVLAPTSASPPPPADAPTVSFPPMIPEPPRPPDIQAPPPPRSEEEPESIFGEVVDDDLFGRPVKPLLEVPPPGPESSATNPFPAAPNMQLEPTFIQMPSLPQPQSATESVPAFGAAQADPFGQVTATVPPPDVAGGDGAALSAPVEWPVSGSPTVPAEEELPPVSVPRTPTTSQSGGMFTIYMMLILVPYAIFMTVLAMVLYFNKANLKDPLEQLWDEGERPGATRDKKGRPQTHIRKRISPDAVLTARQQVPLGGTYRLGDLEVTPQKVELKKVIFRVRRGTRNPEESPQKALVLTVLLKNVSDNLTFYPTDPMFERRWRPENGPTNKPYMFVDLVEKKEAENRRFYGGAFEWPPEREGRAEPIREYIEGQEDHDNELGPGEQLQTVFFTDPSPDRDKPDVVEQLSRYTGKLIWRLQLRRGLATMPDGTEISVTGVVGVTFTTDDIIQ